MNELYGVVTIIIEPCNPDPEILALELVSSFDKALERSEEILEDFIDTYGDDYVEHATKATPVAITGNGDVTAYVYIKKTTLD